MFVLLSILIAGACKKDPPMSGASGDNLLDFKITGELYDAQFSAVSDTILVVIPNALEKTGLTLNFSLSPQATATIGGAGVSSGGTINANSLLNFKITSGDHKNTAKWIIKVQSDLEEYGLGSILDSEKSLDKDYDFYFDQMDGSTYQAVNCGPTVTTMALKWADSTYALKPADARSTIPEDGGWWYTSDVSNYLNTYHISNAYVAFTNATADNVIVNSINNDNLVILCLDMYYDPFNPSLSQRTNKFYTTGNTGWGHFLLVKGYKKVDNKLYYDIYDPNSGGRRYALGNTLKGQDRFYLNSGIIAATAVWWPYAIIVAPKGQQVVSSTRLQVNSLQGPVPVAKGQ
ncbi:MAG TPA: C39 family peptidase [Mucilaginibacter sp.]|nr:C39 family peptidase [Mucilaginibacter sp.]